MRYAILVGDGMGDYPIPELGNKTPLEEADTPHMDAMVRQGGMLGRVRTTPENMEAGSDVANMSIMGYDPRTYHSGRAPIEAASMGVELAPDEIAFRLNLVSLEFQGESGIIMRDHSSGNISTEEAELLIKDLAEKLAFTENQKLYNGVSYRHLLVWPDLANGALPTVPPHDLLDRDVSSYLNQTGPIEPVLDLIKASWDILKDHPINQKRVENGLPPANSIWFWGQGRAPIMDTYQDRWGLTGAVISAVDLIKGLGIHAGLKAPDIEGATGLINTNFEGKVDAALAALEKSDFVLVHVEAPDEASHQGNRDEKILAIELFDKKVVGPMRKGMEKFGDFKIMVLCDHYTPLSVKSHTPEPVPFVIFPGSAQSGKAYSEKEAENSGLYFDQGHALIDLLVSEAT